MGVLCVFSLEQLRFPNVRPERSSGTVSVESEENITMRMFFANRTILLCSVGQGFTVVECSSSLFMQLWIICRVSSVLLCPTLSYFMLVLLCPTFLKNVLLCPTFWDFSARLVKSWAEVGLLK